MAVTVGSAVGQSRLWSGCLHGEEDCDLNACVFRWSQGSFGRRRMLVFLGAEGRLLLVCPVLPVEQKPVIFFLLISHQVQVIDCINI